ncbi:CBS domain-containing protein [Thermocrispum sp.]|jgi:CBS domain-containing protein|uniref:CBS domain-containing protein n=1 Tax=Thermocrispum agreste TaxID=37925 RepID=A0ABD6FIB2_9PSEU|nr:CBS domain-containing protein [Thermocrispum sp.]
MRARDIMTSPAVTVHRDTPVGTAAHLAAESGFPLVPVVGSGDLLVGVVSVADLTAVASESARQDDRLVADMMSPATVAAEVDTDLADLVTTMLDRGVRCLPVVQNSRVVGVITRRDLVRTVDVDQTAARQEIRRRLERYGGRGRWTVAVHNGVATITDVLDDPIDRHIARVLAESVPGIVRAQVSVADDATARRPAADRLPRQRSATARPVR